MTPPAIAQLHRQSTRSSGLRVATYNIHKGVRGVGPRKRLEIHNLGDSIRGLDADLVMLQEVRLFHHQEARRFERTVRGWPAQGQAEFLAPPGYESAYRTNAITRHGEHGNALLSRWPMGDVGHRDVSDHRFEQRGLLHVPISWNGARIHVVVAHLGLMHTSRMRQVQHIGRFVADHVPNGEPLIVGGDFNDWGERLDEPLRELGLDRAQGSNGGVPATFPSRVPVFALDRLYLRGLRCTAAHVPRGVLWSRMSDHLPLVAEVMLRD